ncbi:hypothetical protein [Pseudoclavibacter sp. AY1H1]|uniref:hypothetical protein n=1 Tax=Pseudoclavibacter sp. AY1H1 TaxID=2080584 RepID=UPI000CE8C166|nr:hypothetical protein [Pseudoclavibacter sp. AY1H1]PPF39813.1 hypothetical protein C5E05_00935 [Pseudoclavibacter sp. AY1H1]
MSLIPDPAETYGEHGERTVKPAAEQRDADLERDPLAAGTHVAAAKAGIRTGAQTASTSFAGYAITSQAVTWGDVGAQGVGLVIALGSALLTGVAAGTVSYLSFIGKGVPAEYRV